MELIKREDYDTLLKNNHVILVFLYSTWCPPCRMLKPILQEYIDYHPNELVLLVNTEVFRDIAKLYDVRTVPALLFIRDEQVIKEIDGKVCMEDIENEMNSLHQY